MNSGIENTIWHWEQNLNWKRKQFGIEIFEKVALALEQIFGKYYWKIKYTHSKLFHFIWLIFVFCYSLTIYWLFFLHVCLFYGQYFFQCQWVFFLFLLCHRFGVERRGLRGQTQCDLHICILMINVTSPKTQAHRHSNMRLHLAYSFHDLTWNSQTVLSVFLSAVVFFT